MKRKFTALRYLVGALSINLAVGLVCLAQQATGQQRPAGQTPAAQAAPKDLPTGIAGTIAEWTRAKDYTKEYLDVMPEDGYAFRPTPDIRSFAEQMLHLASANFMFAARITGQANPQQGKNLEKMDELKSKAAVTKVVLESYDFALNAIKGADPAKLSQKVNLFNVNMTGEAALAKAFEHQTHHRGQTTIYLRLKGAKPPQEKLF